MTVIRQYVANKSAAHTCVFESELGRMVSSDIAFLQCGCGNILVYSPLRKEEPCAQMQSGSGRSV